MKDRKLVHPLWVHLPALAALVIFLVYLFMALPLADDVPVHFGTAGTPDQFGSPWEALGLAIGLSALFLGISMLIDELWARQEKKKLFNWLSLLDDVTIGALAGYNLGYLAFLKSGDTVFTFPAVYFWPIFCGAIVLAVLLELVRPWRPYHSPVTATETSGLKTEIRKRLKNNTAFVYWDYQNPGYVTLLTTLLPLALIVFAAFTWMEILWVSILLAVIGLALVIPHGGQRTLVTRDAVTVRWGVFGIPVLRLETADIIAVQLHEFSPLKDFGGYGIRFNREMQAYYMRGNRGVKLTMKNGKNYLIGSDRAPELAAVVEGILNVS